MALLFISVSLAQALAPLVVTGTVDLRSRLSGARVAILLGWGSLPRHPLLPCHLIVLVPRVGHRSPLGLTMLMEVPGVPLDKVLEFYFVFYLLVCGLAVALE